MSAAVYATHCRTYRIARAACGLRAAPGTGRTSWPVGPPGAGLTTFRARPPDRNACGQRLRDEVAALVRMGRRPRGRVENLARSNFSQEITPCLALR